MKKSQWFSCGVFFFVIIGIWEGRGQLENKVNIVKTVPEQQQSGKCSQIYASKVVKGCLFPGKFCRLFKTQVSCSFFAVMKTRTPEREASDSPNTRHRERKPAPGSICLHGKLCNVNHNFNLGRISILMNL